MTLDLELPVPHEFPAFPFNPPYEIQVELMKHLYSAIEDRKVTIVESPTGTGKTLSLLCASLTWLADEKDRARKGKLNAVTEDGVDAKSWVIEQTRERMRREMEADEREYEERLAQARKREALVKKMAKARVVKKTKFDKVSSAVRSDGDDDKFLPESDSFDDGEDMNISPALRALMAKVDKAPRMGFVDGEVEPTCTKIYYASRTHSQLAQILPEMRRLNLRLHVSSLHPLAVTPNTSKPPPHDQQKRSVDELDADDEDTPAPCARTVSLGSRKQLCINDELREKSRDLDESCRELLSEKGNKRCQFLPPFDDETRILDFRDQILASSKDIEDLATAGRTAQTCPYFASRRAIPQAELVTLPYNLLLQRTAREALGINLEGQVVIIDEAHNLIPTLLSLSTTYLSYPTLVTSFQQVCIYVSKFRNRLGPGNMLHLKRLVVFLDALKKYVVEWKQARISKSTEGGKHGRAGSEKSEIVTVAQLMERLGRKAAAVNLLEIAGYLRKSKVARKIAGYSEKEAEKSVDPVMSRNVRRGVLPPLHIVEAFMLSLTGMNEDGRVSLSLIGTPGSEEVELAYQLLNPAPHFREVVDIARSVILAGGTMSPIADVVNQLFSHLPRERLASFSCGHIIPSSNLQALVVGMGPCGGRLEYKAGKQGDSASMGELGQILLNFSGIIPGGMVVFFPSYSFLNTTKATWQKSGTLEKLSRKKKAFFEPEASSDVDRVLQEYSAAVRSPSLSATEKQRGAILFAVVGAKLSEGLNFSDDLARAVVIIGLPFANLGSPELQERMKYVKRLEEMSGSSSKKLPGQKDAAAELYENMCMNAVNQSIGRAIRHRGDWASLVLLDCRYSSPIKNKLPKWIGSGITITEGFGQAIKCLGDFYKSKRNHN